VRTGGRAEIPAWSRHRPPDCRCRPPSRRNSRSPHGQQPGRREVLPAVAGELGDSHNHPGGLLAACSVGPRGGPRRISQRRSTKRSVAAEQPVAASRPARSRRPRNR
jgi:hypothetical protein